MHRIVKILLEIFIRASLRHIQFLEKVNLENILNSKKTLKRACFRYETCWLPLCRSLQNSEKMYPPLDVMWIWSCHMLSPLDYIKDCVNICGKVVDHKYFTKEDTLKLQEETKLKGEHLFACSFDYLSDECVGDHDTFKTFSSQIGYDLMAASSRQKSFFYQVSLPHWTNQNYLSMCLDAYKKFLYLKKKNPSVFVVPSYGIDLMWHTHQMNPIVYANDCKQILGFVLPHDDSVNDRAKGSKLMMAGEETKQLWTTMYEDEYFLAGGMFRGDPPGDDCFARKEIDFRKYSFASGLFNLADMSIASLGDSADSKFKVKILQENAAKSASVVDKVYIATNRNCVLNSEQSAKYRHNDPSSLNLCVEIQSSGLINICNNFIFRKQLQLSTPERNTEMQEFKIQFEGPKETNYTLTMRLSVRNQKTELFLRILLGANKFKSICSEDLEREFSIFNELKHRDPNRKNDLDATLIGIIGEHSIQILSPDNSAESNSKQLYTFEMVHVVSPFRSSSVKIFCENTLLATSHVISLNHLPVVGQFEQAKRLLTLDPNSEKAMLVRNLNGDFAIIKGKWMNVIKGIPGTASQLGTRGNNGHLRVEVFFLNSNVTTKVIEISDISDFVIGNNNIELVANVSDGRINIQFKTEIGKVIDSEIESMIAIALSISTIHVLLQPKKVGFVTIPQLRGDKVIKFVDTETNVMLAIFGYSFLIGLPFFSDNPEQTSCFNGWLNVGTVDGGGGKIICF